jgi:hypothetical protein
MESNLVNKIKRSIIETKEKKEKLLIEQKLVESRIMMIVESESNAKNFHRLSEEKQQKMMYSLLEEIRYLDEQGMVNENLMDFLGKIFGNSFGSAVETIVEPLVNSILDSIGLGGYFKNFLVSSLTTNPLELSRALKSCNDLTKLISAIDSEFLKKEVYLRSNEDVELFDDFVFNLISDMEFVEERLRLLQIGIETCLVKNKSLDKLINLYIDNLEELDIFEQPEFQVFLVKS